VGRTGSDRATYDIILPLFEQVATAEVTLEGSGLTVLPDGETVPYTGIFNPDSNCALATVNDAPLELCFYDASGEDAQALTLGAQLATFLGRQGGGDSATLFGEQRRGVRAGRLGREARVAQERREGGIADLGAHCRHEFSHVQVVARYDDDFRLPRGGLCEQVAVPSRVREDG
jgi:hypothetical protein